MHKKHKLIIHKMVRLIDACGIVCERVSIEIVEDWKMMDNVLLLLFCFFGRD